MSNIDTNTHTVVPYIAGKTHALEGQRLDVVFWKTPKLSDEQKAAGVVAVKPESKCVSVPLVMADDIKNNIEMLIPSIATYLATVQHNIIKERVSAGALHVTNEEISIPACVEYLESQVTNADGTSAHLTKESVGKWFDTELADILTVALADKLGIGDVPTEEQATKLDVAVKMYKDKISSLAGGKTTFGIPLAKSVKNALSLATADDPIATKFIARCDKMMASADEMEALL